MRKVINIAAPLLVASLLASCATTQNTYFRKADASRADERADWGLCGGDFFPDGSVRPDFDRSVLSCMYEKGYRTMNEYYVEQFVDFYDPRSPQDVNSPSFDTKKACGVERYSGGICDFQNVVDRSKLKSFVSCMTAKGYRPILPRSSLAVRIIENGEEVTQAFCLMLQRRK